MGIDPASIIAEATAIFGAGSASAGATAATAATVAGTGATAGTAATAAAAGATAAEAAADTAAVATGASAGLSASTLLSLGTAAAGLGGALLGPKGIKPPSAPKAPSLFGANSGAGALLGSDVGSFGGTFLTGSNRAPQISGGKKTLLGQ